MAGPLSGLHGPADLARPAPWVGNNTTRRILLVLHYAYPIILLAFFLVVFTARSIRSASNASSILEPVTQSGPGGKPLPNTDPTRNAPKSKTKDDVTRSQKLLFEWVSVAVGLTFIGNSINVIVHALYSRKEEWWCGQAVVVSLPPLRARPASVKHTNRC
jgi:hypothetical protein